MGGPGSFMGLKIWNLACSLVLPKGTRMQKIEVDIQKKIASAYLPQKETHVKSWSIGASNELIKPEV